MPVTRTLEAKGLSLGDFEKRHVTCPAGVFFHSESGPPMEFEGARLIVLDNPAVRCKIEKSTVDAATSPSSLLRFCMGSYTACPSWRAEQENRWRARPVSEQNYERRPGNTLVDQAQRGDADGVASIRVQPQEV
jgi:hypothetical protein